MPRSLLNPGLPDVTGTLAVWYRADAGVQRVGEKITSWEDLSGNARHLFALSSAYRPTWRPNGINGYPVVDFASGNGLGSAVAFQLQRKVTSFIVTATTTTRGMLVEHGLGDGHYWYADGNAAFAVFGTTGIGHHRFFKTNWVPLTKSYLTTKYSGTSLTVRVSGVAQTADSTDGVEQTVSATKQLFVGVRSDLTLSHVGQIAEIIIYNSELSVSDTSIIEAYLASRYSI
jgi:hypothetical protein